MIILAFACRDCGTPAGADCDTACPSAAAADHELILAEIDAFEDDQAQTRADRHGRRVA